MPENERLSEKETRLRTARPCPTCGRTGLCADCCCVHPCHRQPWSRYSDCPGCTHKTREPYPDAEQDARDEHVSTEYARSLRGTEVRRVMWVTEVHLARHGLWDEQVGLDIRAAWAASSLSPVKTDAPEADR